MARTTAIVTALEMLSAHAAAAGLHEYLVRHGVAACGEDATVCL